MEGRADGPVRAMIRARSTRGAQPSVAGADGLGPHASRPFRSRQTPVTLRVPSQFGGALAIANHSDEGPADGWRAVPGYPPPDGIRAASTRSASGCQRQSAIGGLTAASLQSLHGTGYAHGRRNSGFRSPSAKGEWRMSSAVEGELS